VWKRANTAVARQNGHRNRPERRASSWSAFSDWAFSLPVRNLARYTGSPRPRPGQARNGKILSGMGLPLVRRTRLDSQWLALGIGITLWLCTCAVLLAREINNPRGIGICAVLVVAPLLILKIARLPVYLVAAYAALVPFDQLLGTGAGPSYLRLLALLTGFTLALSMVAMRRVVKPSRSLVVLLLLAAYTGASIFWAVDPSIALSEYGVYASEMLLFAVIALYPVSPNDMRLILASTILGAIIAAAYGDFFFSHAQALDPSRLDILLNSGQTEIDPNEFATVLLVPIAVTLMMFMRSRNVAAKLSWLAGFLILLSGFAISGSRGVTLALAAMGCFLLWRSPYKKQLIAIACASLFAIIASPAGQRFAQLDVGSGDGRLDIWKIGIASLHQYWLTGAGVGNFNQAFMQYFLTVPHQPLGWDRVAHSIFIQTAVELGVFGFALMMAFWYLEFRDLARVDANGLAVDICTALRSGIVGIFVAGFSLSLMTSKYTWLAFSLVALMRSALITSGVPIDAPGRRDPRKQESENLESLRAKLAGGRLRVARPYEESPF
jgi:hypothetical protein